MNVVRTRRIVGLWRLAHGGCRDCGRKERLQFRHGFGAKIALQGRAEIIVFRQAPDLIGIRDVVALGFATGLGFGLAFDLFLVGRA